MLILVVHPGSLLSETAECGFFLIQLSQGAVDQL